MTKDAAGRRRIKLFARKLREGAKACGYSYADLARNVGVSPNAFKHYVSGRNLPHPSITNGIADALGLDREYFTDDTRPVGDNGANRLAIDADLMGDLAEAMGAIYDRLNIQIGRREFQVLVADEYTDIVASAASPADRRKLVPLCACKLKNALTKTRAKKVLN